MDRVEIINTFIRTRGYKSYLEIGVSRGDSFRGVDCAVKVGVDPDLHSAATVFKTSDEFFASNNDKFDIVFIDGLHRCDQVLRDIDNALRALRKGGVVVLHDCLPGSAREASEVKVAGAWCGDVYRAAVWHFVMSEHLCYVVDADHGIGVIDTLFPTAGRVSPPHVCAFDLSYPEFSKRRDSLLRIVPDGAVRSMIDHGSTSAWSRPLYVITPTGDRDAAIRLCIRHMNRQTRKPDRWIIVDDGVSGALEELSRNIEVPHEVVRLPPMKGHSLVRNMRAGLERVPDDAMLCIVEDDDWYGRDYLEHMAAALERSPAAGTWGCFTYNVARRCFMHGARVNRHVALHGLAVSGAALAHFRRVVAEARGYSLDRYFCRGWTGGFSYSYCAPVVHIAGIPCARRGTTSPHRLGECLGAPWCADPCGEVLRDWVGDDYDAYAAFALPQYAQYTRDICGGMSVSASSGAGASSAGGRVYVFSNVRYCESARIHVQPDDVLMFTNSAASFRYYKGHGQIVVVHRYPNRESRGYGSELSGASHVYIYGSHGTRVPSAFVRALWARYDKKYDGERRGNGRVIRSMTTGYIAAKYAEHAYPGREIVLVNFGFSVENSTYRSPAHNWVFEDRDLSSFRHVFTGSPRFSAATVHRSAYAVKVLSTIGRDWGGTGSSVWAVRPEADYSVPYAKYLSALSHEHVVVLTVGFPSNSAHVSGIGSLLPCSGVYAICTSAGTCDVSAVAWEALPPAFGLIIVNGARIDAGFSRSFQALASRLSSGGVLLVEGVSMGGAAESVAASVHGARVETDGVVDPRGDVAVVAYTNNTRSITDGG